MQKTSHGQATFLIATGLLVALATGCHDHRIDVYEFLELQSQLESRSAGCAAGKKPACPPRQKHSHSAVEDPSEEAETGRWIWNPRRRKWTLTNERTFTLVSHHDETVGQDDEHPVHFGGSQMDAILEELHKPYQVGHGDVLKVALTGLTGVETLPDPTEVLARVNRDGEITLPFIKPVTVGGLEVEDAEKAILDAYVPKVVNSLAVSVSVEEYKTTNVLVVGAAELPGLVRLPRTRRNVVHAVASAGGMSQDASGEITLQRIRNPKEKIELYLRNSHDLKTVLALEPLESGDVITVKAAQPNTIFVGGLVNLPGPKEYPPDTEINALQLLAAAGGVIGDVCPTEATLIRRMPNGEDVHVRIDLEKMKRGEDPNIMLAAGDVFWIPETVGTRVLDFINRTVVLRAGATVTYNVTGVEFLNRRSQQSAGLGGNNNTQNAVDPIGFLVP